MDLGYLLEHKTKRFIICVEFVSSFAISLHICWFEAARKRSNFFFEGETMWIGIVWRFDCYVNLLMISSDWGKKKKNLCVCQEDMLPGSKLQM